MTNNNLVSCQWSFSDELVIAMSLMPLEQDMMEHWELAFHRMFWKPFLHAPLHAHAEMHMVSSHAIFTFVLKT